MQLSTLETGALQLRSVTEIAPKSPLLRVNRSPSVRYDFRAGAKATRYSVNIVQNSLILSRFLKAGPSTRFEDRRRKESSTEFPNQHPKDLKKKGDRDKLYWNINTTKMSILRKKSHRTLNVFLSAHGLIVFN